MMKNVNLPPPEGVGNYGGINPPPIDHAPNPPSRRNRRNKSGISRVKRGWESKSNQETAVVAAFSAKVADPPAVDMGHDDLHGMSEDDTNIQMGLELTSKKLKSVQNQKGYHNRRKE